MRLKMRKRETNVDRNAHVRTWMECGWYDRAHRHLILSQWHTVTQVCTCVQHMTCSAPLRWTRKRTYRQHHESQCECSSRVLQATPQIVGLKPSVLGPELTGYQVSKLIHCLDFRCNEVPSIRTGFLKQSFSIVLECFVAQSVVHNLTELHHRSGSKDWFSVQRIQLRDTCLRFLEQIITLQCFCIFRVMLKTRICVYTHRRLPWIAIGCKRNSQQRRRTLYQKNVGVHLFAALENSLNRRVGVFQCRLSNFASAMGFPRACPSVLLDTRWSILAKRKFELIIRVSLHDGGLPRWFGLCTGTLKFDFECPRAVRCTWTSDIENLSTVLISIPPHHVFKIQKRITGCPILVMNSQLLFADSLTSTSLHWLGYATGLSVLARLHSHIQLMLESLLSLYFPAVMVLEVMYQTSNHDNTWFTCKRQSKSACWTNSWQVFPNIFRCNFGEDIADLCIDCVDVQWLLALVVGGNPSDSPRRSSWTSPRTWTVPCQSWSSQNLISSNKF